MIPSLRDLEQLGCIGPTDSSLARALTRMSGWTGGVEVELATALVSRLVAAGHVCLSLDAPPAIRDLVPESALDAETVEAIDGWRWPEPEAWAESLLESGIARTVEGAADSPLVLDDARRLYLRRYHIHERALAAALLERATDEVEVDEAVLRDGLARAFGDAPGESAGEAATARASDGQRRAVEAASRRRLCVISGGPGTGKTSTVARILVLAVEQARALGRPDPHIVLIAPTGKAAAALTAALGTNLEGVDCEDSVREAIPRTASTIHRALGVRGGVGAGFRHDAENPLTADLVVVDEASMVDLALMRRLVAAVPESASLVMMGDADQLASVEAGAVLADVCGGGEAAEQAGPMAPAIARLTHSYRFAADSGIGELARAVRAGEVADAFTVLEDAGRGDVVWAARDGRAWPAEVVRCVDDGFETMRNAESPTEGLAALGRFRVLCPHRVGLSGVEALNHQIGARVTDVARSNGGLAAFEPILVERNDPAVSLWNGDMGVRSRGEVAGEGAPVHFEAGADDEAIVRSMSELRLPAHSRCWAMSVHKSQGSEFDEVLIVLPEHASPLTSREMLYTAITRARSRVTIWGSREVLTACIERRVERRSGLRDALWSGATS